MSAENIHISALELSQAEKKGPMGLLECLTGKYQALMGGSLTGETMALLDGNQLTLMGYVIFREEMMEGGFIQLIHNGYGPFIFENPFAKAMRLWGNKDFSKFIYAARKYYEEKKEELTQDGSEEDFMALYEAHPEFDDLDDEYVEEEETITKGIADYVKAHIECFATIDNK